MPEILPSSVSAPVAVTIIVPLPCVTGVFMNAMFDWSPGPRSPAGSVSASLAAGVLSRQRGLVDLQRGGADDAPVGRDLVHRRQQDDVPGDEFLRRDLDVDAVRHTRAVAFIIDLSALIALSALPSCRRPTTAFPRVNANSTAAVLHSWISRETTVATDRMIYM
jgi:hypothetical protein